MARRFSAQRGATRVVFGSGSTAGLAAAIDAVASAPARVMVVCTPRQKAAAEALATSLGSRNAGVLATAREHVPLETVDAARTVVEAAGADGLVAFGGGSAIGLAKALARDGKVRVIAVPTTYSGSEMTPVYGVTEQGEKRTGRDERVRPILVVYDPELTASLPRDVTVASLWNAMAHAIEALWVDGVDRATRLAAEEALRLLGSSVSRLSVNKGDRDAREDALEGAYLAGAVFADAGPGLHHKLCHVLGGALGLPHAATHAALLPHVVRFQAKAAPHAMEAIARALRVIDPVGALEKLAAFTGAPRGLATLGMPREGIAKVADAMQKFPVDRDGLIALLEAAYAAPTELPARPGLRGPDVIGGQPGFSSTHDSEALPGALPRTQNTPRPAPYGLYPDLISGTPFTVKSAQNSRIWMYRIRPSFSHDAFRALPEAAFTSTFGDVEANRTRWSPLPIPPAPSRVDFLDGLVTLGGAGEPTAGPGYAIHLYCANADMADRSFSTADGDLLIVPQTGTLDCRTELGWLRVPVGSILVIPRGLKFSMGLPDGEARGWMLEVYGTRIRLPERGPIGSNGLADARHFLAPTAAYEDRLCPGGFEIVHKTGGRLYAATQEHSPFDVVAWHGNHVPVSYDLMLFNAMGSVTFDHVDPSIHTVLTAPLDDHGRAVCDFVAFRGRWDVAEHSFRPPYMHRNAATEINGVVRTPSPEGGYVPGCTFISPLLTAHGIATASYDAVLSQPDEVAEGPRRMPDASLWIMFESALPFRTTAWARDTPLVDKGFLAIFEGMKKRFDPAWSP